MRNAVVAISIALAAGSAWGAVQYEFRQVTQSDVENIPNSEFSGRAIIDGDRSRVEFLAGSAYPPGTYVIATNGSRMMTWVDPSKKAYVEVNAAAVASAIGTGKITIANKKITAAQLDDHPLIAGMPTDHYKVTLSYDMTIGFGSLPVTQSITQVVDKWTSSAYANVAESFFATGGDVHTGNPDLDELIEAEATKSKGFPLRQTVQISTVSHTADVPGSALKVNRTRTVSREFTITAIETKATVAPGTFIVPITFHKADPLHDDSQKPAMLSLEPAN